MGGISLSHILFFTGSGRMAFVGQWGLGGGCLSTVQENQQHVQTAMSYDVMILFRTPMQLSIYPHTSGKLNVMYLVMS